MGTGLEWDGNGIEMGWERDWNGMGTGLEWDGNGKRTRRDGTGQEREGEMGWGRNEDGTEGNVTKRDVPGKDKAIRDGTW